MKANRSRYRAQRSCVRCGERFEQHLENRPARMCVGCRRLDAMAIVRWTPPDVNVLPGSKWVAGDCRVCGDSFVSPYADVTCSDVCKRLRRRPHPSSKDWITPVNRAAIYLRDGFICQLCFAPVDKDAGPSTDYYPSLDHIIPRSQGGTDEETNLHTAHRICNSIRRDLPLDAARELFLPDWARELSDFDFTHGMEEVIAGWGTLTEEDLRSICRDVAEFFSAT
jgi:5-methylcytosine-specific restriction endonuclease McrA